MSTDTTMTTTPPLRPMIDRVFTINEVLRNALPILSTASLTAAEMPIKARIVYPAKGWAWYVVEYDKDHDEAFGYVVGWESEWGSFSILELLSVAMRTSGDADGLQADTTFEPTDFAVLFPDRV